MDDTKREWVRWRLVKAHSDLRSARALVELAEQVNQGRGTSHPNMPIALPTPLYTTDRGRVCVGDSLDLLPCLPADPVHLVITSPPFALLRQKEYGIAFLTDPGDTVLDIFAGSNTTGGAAEKLDRRWLAFEKDRTYLASSAFRFVDELPAAELAALRSRLHADDLPVEVHRQQRELMLLEGSAHYFTRRRLHERHSRGKNAH